MSSSEESQSAATPPRPAGSSSRSSSRDTSSSSLRSEHSSAADGVAIPTVAPTVEDASTAEAGRSVSREMTADTSAGNEGARATVQCTKPEESTGMAAATAAAQPAAECADAAPEPDGAAVMLRSTLSEPSSATSVEAHRVAPSPDRFADPLQADTTARRLNKGASSPPLSSAPVSSPRLSAPAPAAPATAADEAAAIPLVPRGTQAVHKRDRYDEMTRRDGVIMAPSGGGHPRTRTQTRTRTRMQAAATPVISDNTINAPRSKRTHSHNNATTYHNPRPQHGHYNHHHKHQCTQDSGEHHWEDGTDASVLRRVQLLLASPLRAAAEAVVKAMVQQLAHSPDTLASNLMKPSEAVKATTPSARGKGRHQSKGRSRSHARKRDTSTHETSPRAAIADLNEHGKVAQGNATPQRASRPIGGDGSDPAKRHYMMPTVSARQRSMGGEGTSPTDGAVTAHRTGYGGGDGRRSGAGISAPSPFRQTRGRSRDSRHMDANAHKVGSPESQPRSQPPQQQANQRPKSQRRLVRAVSAEPPRAPHLRTSSRAEVRAAAAAATSSGEEKEVATTLATAVTAPQERRRQRPQPSTDYGTTMKPRSRTASTAAQHGPASVLPLQPQQRRPPSQQPASQQQQQHQQDCAKRVSRVSRTASATRTPADTAEKEQQRGGVMARLHPQAAHKERTTISVAAAAEEDGALLEARYWAQSNRVLRQLERMLEEDAMQEGGGQ